MTKAERQEAKELEAIGPLMHARTDMLVRNQIMLMIRDANDRGDTVGRITLHPRKFERLLREEGVEGDLLTKAMKDGLLVISDVWIVRVGEAE